MRIAWVVGLMSSVKHNGMRVTVATPWPRCPRRAIESAARRYFVIDPGPPATVNREPGEGYFTIVRLSVFCRAIRIRAKLYFWTCVWPPGARW